MDKYLITKDYAVSQEEFELLYHEELDMLVTHPEPDDIDRYYESGDYISHTDASRTLTEKIYQAVKKYSLGKKVRLIGRHAKEKGRLLDVGAGTGDFLLHAQKKGWQVSGVEPNAGARDRALEKGLQLLPDLKLMEGQALEVITLWHVLEHLPDLDQQIKALLSLLAPGGTLIVAVPNFRSFDARYYKAHWAAYDVPRHLWHFSRTSIKRLFGKHGMEVVETRPMIFDSFYVSLLSEKYRTGRTNMFRAFWTGLRSNLKALHTKEHSSLIYILKNTKKPF